LSDPSSASPAVRQPFGRSSWQQAVAIYRDPLLLGVLLLGFTSGLPSALILSTLAIRLAEQGIQLSTIGLFALVTAPFTLKFAWAPLVDRLPLPLATARLGRRRSWGILAQLLLAAPLLGLGAADPQTNGWAEGVWRQADLLLAGLLGHSLLGSPPAQLPVLVTGVAALLVALAAATQDIVVDAWRVETLPPHKQGAGAAVAVLGYRLGLLASGAGALYLATYLGWLATYAIMASLVSVGVLTLLLYPEPAASQRVPAVTPAAAADQATSVGRWLREAVIGPLAEFTRRPGWVGILLFVALFKLGDALAGVMAPPFYVATGFTKIEIAQISKLFGLTATIIGGLVGGSLVARIGVMRSLLLCGLLQALSNLLFAVQAVVGHSLLMLTVTIGVENLSGGMATAAFVAYLSGLCSVLYTATQYALLTSITSLARTLLSSVAGWLAGLLGWTSFFVASTFAAAPGLLLLLWLTRRHPPRS